MILRQHCGEQLLPLLVVKAPDDDDPSSSAKKLTVDAVARASAVVFSRVS